MARSMPEQGTRGQAARGAESPPRSSVTRPWKSPGDGRIKGESCKAQVYDDLVPQVLDRVQIGAVTLTQVMGGLASYPDTAFAVARIKRDREAAAAGYLRDRDPAALDQAMARLDVEETEAKASTQVVERSEALSRLRDLLALWAAADDSGRRLLTERCSRRSRFWG
jgi:hypothetical protein